MQPLSIYIHWPFCKKKCPYCDFNSHVRESVDYDRWQKALLRDLEKQGARVKNRELVSIFFGGGTPSLMPPMIVEALLQKIAALWKMSSACEITLEANPTSVEAENFRALRAAGVNRVSLGIQSLRDEELKFLGREHSVKEALKTVELASAIFNRYSFDLIYARPHQTVQTWEKELREALSYAGDHLSLYQLTIEEETPFARVYAKGGFALPDEDTAADLYELTATLCAEKNLHAYEISNYAKPGQECRHNLAYWKGDEYLGIGPGAHGRVRVQSTEYRVQEENPAVLCTLNSELWVATATLKSPERWLALMGEKGEAFDAFQPVSPTDRAEELVLTGLRLQEGLDMSAIRQRTGIDPATCFNPLQLATALREGLLIETPNGYRATASGRLVVNHLITALLSPVEARMNIL